MSTVRKYTYHGEPLFRAMHPDDPRQRTRSTLHILMEDFCVDTPKYGRLVAPAGMITDKASIPSAAWGWLAPDDRMILFPAVIHDAMYELRAKLTREEADDLLRDMMLDLGCRPTQAWAVHKAVRWFGGSRWESSQ